MGWKTINGNRTFVGNPKSVPLNHPNSGLSHDMFVEARAHEYREDKAIKKLESDIARLRNPNTAMNPIASASIIKAMQSEISGLKSINNMQDKKLRQKTRKEWFNDHKELQ